MQRQSLGSPGSKPPHPLALAADALNAEEASADDRKRRRKSIRALELAADEESKPERAPMQPSRERSIHLIPVLTFLCFLVLYLFSHDPTPPDFAEFGGFGAVSDSGAMGLAAEVNSQRGLKELEKLRGGANQQHRKLRGGRGNGRR